MTEENKRTVQEVHKIQKDIKRFVKEELEEEKKGNSLIMYIILVLFIIASGVYIYSMLSMKSRANDYTEAVEKKSNHLYELARDMNKAMNMLYKEQKEFLKENKCNVVEKKESAGVSKNVNIR